MWRLAILVLFIPTLSFAASPLATTTKPLPTPYAAVDRGHVLSLQANPLIMGSAGNLRAPLSLQIILPASGSLPDQLWYANAAVPVQNNRWSVVVFPAIPRGLYRLELRSSTSLLATSTLSIGLPSQPVVEVDPSLPVFDVADGKLLHFKVSARGNSNVSIGKLTFSVIPNGTTVDSTTLYGFTDPDYTQPIATTTDGTLVSGTVDADSSRFVALPDAPIVIPAHQTYYFELAGVVSPTDATYSVATALVGDDGATAVGSASDILVGSNFVWSPNLTDEASTTSGDWTDGTVAPGLLGRGPSAVRSNAPGAPICDLGLSTTTTKVGSSVTATWSSSNANYAVWENSTKEVPQGSKTFSNLQLTHTYILTFYAGGGNGTTTCFATVAVGTPLIIKTVATSTATTTSPVATTTDSFVATPITGPLSSTSTLVVSFVGSVNNSKSCKAGVWSLGYGDKATSTVNVGINTCKAVAFSFSHTYTKVGSYLAILATSTGTTTSQVVQRQIITVTAKISFFTSQVAGALGGWSKGVYDFLAHTVLGLFGR